MGKPYLDKYSADPQIKSFVFTTENNDLVEWPNKSHQAMPQNGAGDFLSASRDQSDSS